VELLGAVLYAVVFAGIAVRVRRHFDTEELILASGIFIAVTIAGIIAFGWGKPDFLYGPLIGAATVGTIAAAAVVNYLVARSPDPDVPIMHVLAVVAFGVGAVLGFFGGFLFFLQGSSWTG
jgi:hypothetical protein